MAAPAAAHGDGAESLGPPRGCSFPAPGEVLAFLGLAYAHPTSEADPGQARAVGPGTGLTLTASPALSGWTSWGFEITWHLAEAWRREGRREDACCSPGAQPGEECSLPGRGLPAAPRTAELLALTLTRRVLPRCSPHSCRKGSASHGVCLVFPPGKQAIISRQAGAPGVIAQQHLCLEDIQRAAAGKMLVYLAPCLMLHG